MSKASNSVIINQCGRLLVSTIEHAFQTGAWKHDVELFIEKTKPGWFDTQIAMRISWKGEQANVDRFTEAAKDYLTAVGAY